MAVYWSPISRKWPQRPGGTISVDSFPSGSLGKNPRLQLKMMADGVFDITWAVAAYTPGRFPDNGVMELPGIFKTSREASIILWRLYDRGLLRGFDKIKVLGFGGLPPYLIHSRKPIESLGDLRRLKVRAGGPIHGAMVKGLGTTPVGMPSPSIAENISRGTLDAASIDWIGADAFRILDVAKLHYEAELGSNVLMLVMDRENFDGLPDEARATFDKFGGENLSRELGNHMDAVSNRLITRLRQGAEHSLVAPQGADLASLNAIKQEGIADWLSETRNGEQTLAAARSIVADVRAGN